MASTSANDPDSVPTAEEVVSMYLSGLTLAQRESRHRSHARNKRLPWLKVSYDGLATATNTDCTTAGDDANEVMIDQSGASGTEGESLS